MATNADSVLWDGIRQVAVLIRQQSTEAALQRVQRLLPLADSLHSRPALVSLRAQGAACLMELGRTEEALREFRLGAEVCEQDSWLENSVKNGQEQWLNLCISMYVQLAVVNEKEDHRQEAAKAARHAVQWIAWSSNRQQKTQSLLALGHLLTESMGKQRAKELFTQAFYDAKALGSKDMILMAATQLLELGVDQKLLELEQEASAAHTPSISEEKKDTSGKKFMMTQQDTTDLLARSTQPPPTEKKTDNGWIGLLLLCLLLLLFTVFFIKQRRTKRIQTTRSYIEGREEERRRIARELHDGVSNQLLALQMKLSGEGNTERVRQLLDESREQVRRVSHGLMPPEFTYATLDEVVSLYITELNESSMCDISFHITPDNYDWGKLPQQQALAIYRIIQEAVTNALQHARATVIAVGMHQKGKELVIIVSDNGKTSQNQSCVASGPAAGDATQVRQGIGLRTMHQWADSIGATIEVMDSTYSHTVRLTLGGGASA